MVGSLQVGSQVGFLSCRLSHPCVESSYIVSRLVSVTSSILQNWWYALLRLGHKRAAALKLVSCTLLDHLFWEKAVTMP